MIYSRKEITNALEAEVKNLVEWASGLDDETFFQSLNSKWSTAEQIEHLRKSSWPLAQGLGKPKFILKLVVGKPNRPSRDFNSVVDKYKTKLAAITQMPTTRFYPNLENDKTKEQILENYLAISQKLLTVISKWREDELDRYIVPHPLLGKLTVREMMFFTIFHTQHHFNSVTQLYSQNKE